MSVPKGFIGGKKRFEDIEKGVKGSFTKSVYTACKTIEMFFMIR